MKRGSLSARERGPMERYICIHGHFYQPPRENAWLEFVELQDSAYPFHDWNERITAECYAPNGTSRILDGYRTIVKITNNYAHISFNFGPTLLDWLKDKEPETYQTILDADKASRRRFSGHGNAIAQAYNHAILPLCNARDKYTQAYWGVRDFEARFGRPPEGMWLPETAVDIETLDILARMGIRFTILSPYQAKRTRKIKGRSWRDASGAKVDPSMPYYVRLPSGRRIAVFFYDAPISQAIAFERLLEKGENLAGRLTSAFSDARTWPQIVHIATDGETYGHHHKKGEMALAYALHHIETNNPGMLTNYAEYLERHPPGYEAEIWERSAWSCAHGVERWNSNCGCNSGGYPNWNQEWRSSLRQAFDWLRDTIATPFVQKARGIFRDPWAARNEYISVILNRDRENVDRFLREHATHELSDEEQITALKLMEMQRHAMLMYTSCGWFFDELSGIETTQVIQYAARTVQLYETVFREKIESMFLDRLAAAKSNIPANQDGRVIYEKFVKPAMVDRKKVAAHHALISLFEPQPEEGKIYCYNVQLEDSARIEAGRSKLLIGRAHITSEITRESEVLSFGALHIGDHLMNCGVRKFEDEQNYIQLKEEMIDPFNRADFPEVIRILDRHFGESTYSLRSIFHDDQRKILNLILQSTLAELETVYRQLYETHAPMLRFVSDLRVPLPRAFLIGAEFALNGSLRTAFEDAGNLDFTRINTLIEEARAQSVSLDGATLGYALGETIRRLSEAFVEDPDDLELMKKLEAAAALARSLPFEVPVWRAQNYYYQVLEKIYPERARKAQDQQSAREWIEHFVELGKNLAVKVEMPAVPELELAS
jgi:alpha-amylase/alpha-mannosidase (GH57 family)